MQHLACPTCHKSLAGDLCSGCSETYPRLGEIPWLVTKPKAKLEDWGLRFRHYLQSLDDEINLIKDNLKSPHPSAKTTKRLQKFLQAKVEHKKSLSELLGPLGKSSTQTSELYKAGGITLPPSQSLTGYYQNIHRDWSWDTEENALSLNLILESLGASLPRGSLGVTAVLGSGAGRLGYDLHQTELPKNTYLLDFNPLMLLVAQRVLLRRSLKLFEFPIAPKTADDFQILQKLAVSQEPKPGLHVIGGDALQTPFANSSLDTVVTPWLVDILPVDAAFLLKEIHRILKPKGKWIYFGSMAFDHKSKIHNYSFEEFLELTEQMGFLTQNSLRRSIPYMASPHSCHSRTEYVTTLYTEKLNPLPEIWSKSTSPLEVLPPWLQNFAIPVPRSPSIHSKNLVHQISAKLLALIDGRSSLQDIAKACVDQGLLETEEAQAYCFRFLRRLHLES